MRIALYGHRTEQNTASFFKDFLQELKNRQIEFWVHEDFKQILDSVEVDLITDAPTFKYRMPSNVVFDFMFTFGGDGTILRAATILQETRIPVVGVNTGRLGFLATIHYSEILEKLDKVLSLQFYKSSRTLIGVQSKNRRIEFPFALNEIAVTRKETTSMITVEVLVDGVFLNKFWSDGLIVSTPTGSTGYSLSCGGPIIAPENEAFVITPIAPHNLNVRPLIISDKHRIELKVNSRVPEFLLSLDSRLVSMNVGESLHLYRMPFQLDLVQEEKNTYFQTLHKKLLWGSDSRN